MALEAGMAAVEADHSQMLHGAGIFTYIKAPKMVQFCR